MSGPVDLAGERAERRRKSTFWNLKNDFVSLATEAQRISALGNEEAALALSRLRRKLQLLDLSAESLQGEFIELAELDHETERNAHHNQAQERHAQ